MHGTSWWILALRWIAVVPLLPIGYVMGTWLYFFGLDTIFPFVDDLRYANDFMGKYALGPLIVFGWHAFATFLGAWVSIKTAPSHRFVVAACLATLLLVFLLAGAVGLGMNLSSSQLSYEHFARGVVQVAAHVVGFAMALRDEFDSFKNYHGRNAASLSSLNNVTCDRSTINFAEHLDYVICCVSCDLTGEARFELGKIIEEAEIPATLDRIIVLENLNEAMSLLEKHQALKAAKHLSRVREIVWPALIPGSSK